jgi:bla regulator protein blaR1
MTAWLADTLFYTGLLIALVLLLRRPVARWFGPQVAYSLWALPLLRLLLPPIVLPASLAPTVESEAAAATGRAAVPASERIGSMGAAPVGATESAAAGAPAWAGADLAPFALSIWLGVAIAFLAWRVATYKRMRRELLIEARSVGEVGRIRLVETPALAAPVAFGVRDKVIALPPLFMAQPDLAARDLAIAHELAHHRAHDLLANYAAQVLLALHWFNPLAWLGWRAMRRDQEAACDARVLAGRGRQERALYAALIADIAAGPRLALAAPMACPLLGEKSIVHRLQSLSRGEIAPARRRLGRGLVLASALALPATASFSYAAAHAQPPETSASRASLELPQPPVPPAHPVSSETPEAGERPMPAIVIERPVVEGEDGQTAVRQFTVRRVDRAPLPPAVGQLPRSELRVHPSDPQWQRQMEQFERDMERWGEEYGRQMEQWGREFGERQAAQARAFAMAPEVIHSCDEGEQGRTTIAHGSPRVVICQRAIEARAMAQASSSLRAARASIAGSRAMSESVRREVIEELDEEIARLERGDH